MSTEWVTIATFPLLAPADVCRSVLEAAGIPVFVKGENTSAWLSGFSAFGTSVELQVPADEADRAVAILEQEVTQNEYAADGEEDPSVEHWAEETALTPEPYVIKRLEDTPETACPCGISRRILTGEDNDLVSIHHVTIDQEARKHYHERLTEYYVILDGEGEIELNDDRVAVSPGDVVMIPPGTAHVARGRFEIINIVCPPFDSDDEFTVE
ncbi:MAG TPA: cupin domain-containing protein [Candidatus Hydrogenedentes bacterium]|nr:cupin domain-containing protein [Candidatus Hydrogenedentota bacterium]HPG66829.1 cupin domain-containing protein [Candidatus Hydrogenedentota bacterium]